MARLGTLNEPDYAKPDSFPAAPAGVPVKRKRGFPSRGWILVITLMTGIGCWVLIGLLFRALSTLQP